MPKSILWTTNQLKYHRPAKIGWNADAAAVRIPALSQESKQCVLVSIYHVHAPLTFEICLYRCLRNLAAYQAPKQRMKFPRSRCAAVLVALFVGRHGDLYVLLSRYVGHIEHVQYAYAELMCSVASRSSTLRTYAGDTSLPGGKVDLEDRSIEDTAVGMFYCSRSQQELAKMVYCSGGKRSRRFAK